MRLTRFETGWAQATLETIFPGSDDGLVGVSQMDVAGFFQDVLGSVPFRAAAGLRLTLWLVALAPLFMIGRFALFASLSAADRETVLGKLMSHRSYVVRQLVMALKAVGALLYAGAPAVRLRMQQAKVAQSGKRPLVQLRLKPATGNLSAA
jgi:hypothetical protein